MASLEDVSGCRQDMRNIIMTLRIPILGNEISVLDVEESDRVHTVRTFDVTKIDVRIMPLSVHVAKLSAEII